MSKRPGSESHWDWATESVFGGSKDRFRDCMPFIRHSPKDSTGKPVIRSSSRNSNDAAATPTSFPGNTNTSNTSNTSPHFTKDSISAEKCSKLSPGQKLPLPPGSSSFKRPATAQMSEEACEWPDGEMLERFTAMKNKRSNHLLRRMDTGFGNMYEKMEKEKEKEKEKENAKGKEKEKGKGKAV